MTKLRSTGIALFLILLPMAMLYPLWGNPLSAGEDDVVYYYPLRKMVGDELAQGRLPLYNPREATGVPLMADPQTAVMHPTTWLFAVLDAKVAYTLSLFAAFAMAGGGAMLYLRRLGLVRPAAIIGAIAFMFCGFMVGHRVHLSVILAAAMLPWGLWSIEGLRSGGRRLAAALWMVPVAFLVIASGHWPTLIHMGLILFAYLLFRGRPLLPAMALAGTALLVAVLIAWPQIHLTFQLLEQATRNKIGYAMAGENSFLPTSAVLAFFPFLMGSRNPNVFAQEWWGTWHLCEMLGYVGLATLVLAGAAMWRLFRKPKRSKADAGAGVSLEAEQANPFTPLVRCWTWIILGGGVFMLGYYLPTYRLVHMLPVLGVVRCPARMVLAVDMGLATLAAVAIHVLLTSATQESRVARLRRTALRLAVFVLPAIMAGWLVLFYIVGQRLLAEYPDKFPFLPFEGGARAALDAVKLTNPATFVPLITMALTAAILVFWLRSPRSVRRLGLLIVLLVADLFVVTRFVDVPGPQKVSPDPEVSPAAAFLRQYDGDVDGYRVLGLSDKYFHRPNELLLPKTCESLGFSTVANYGAFQSPYHVEMFGFRIWGYNRYWESLVRRNHLLSLYGVKYILAAEPEFRRAIESVRVAAGPAVPDGPNLVGDKWESDNSANARRLGIAAKVSGSGASQVISLYTPFMWWTSKAEQFVKVEPDRVYRIAFDARGPDAGAALFLRAELLEQDGEGNFVQHDEQALMAEAEQIGPEWRHLEWTLRTSPLAAGQKAARALLRIYSIGERPVEVRGVSLRRSRIDQPINLGGRLGAGQAVYRLVALLPALDPKEPPVAIYQNLLAQPVPGRMSGPVSGQKLVPANTANVEALKYAQAGDVSGGMSVPDISLHDVGSPLGRLKMVTLPVAGLYLIGVALYAIRFRKSKGLE